MRLPDRDRPARPLDAHRADLLPEPERAVHVAHLVGERFGDLGVHELEQPRPLVDERHLDPERREHRRVLRPDDAGPDDRHRSRDLAHLEDPVGGDDGLPVDRHPLGNRRHGADRHDDVRRLRVDRLFGPLDAQRVRIEERGGSRQDANAIAPHLIADDLDLPLDDVVAAHHEVRHRDGLFEAVPRAVEPALLVAAQIEDRLAEGLRGDRPRVDADPADDLALLADRDPFAELRRLHRRPLPRRPRSDDEHVEFEHAGQCMRRRRGGSRGKTKYLLERFGAAAAGDRSVAGEAEAVLLEILLHFLLPGVDDSHPLDLVEARVVEPRPHVVQRGVILRQEVENRLRAHPADDTTREGKRNGAESERRCTSSARFQET